MVSLFANGMSVATNSTPDSIKVEMKATLRESRSSFATTSFPFQLLTGGDRGGELRPVAALAAARLIQQLQDRNFIRKTPGSAAHLAQV
jgi:hypothetical protein